MKTGHLTAQRLVERHNPSLVTDNFVWEIIMNW